MLHIVNLCAKSIIRQFDIQEREGDEPIDQHECALQDLAGDISLEEEQHAEFQMQHAHANECGEDKDDTEGWVDEMSALSQAEQDQLHVQVQLVKLILVKVCDNVLRLIWMDSPAHSFEILHSRS